MFVLSASATSEDLHSDPSWMLMRESERQKALMLTVENLNTSLVLPPRSDLAFAQLLHQPIARPTAYEGTGHWVMSARSIALPLCN